MNRTEPKNLAKSVFNRVGVKGNKTRHFIGGALLVVSVAMLGRPAIGLVATVVMVIVIGIVDYFDDNPSSDPSFLDALATIAGGIVAYYLLT
jgi:hypothetical protein